MAKQQKPVDDKQINKLVQELEAAIQRIYSSAKQFKDVGSQSLKANRDLLKELLKTLALLQAGFAENEEDAKGLIDKVRGGLELTDEYATKWAKERKATKKDLKEIVDKFREIEDLQDDQLDAAEEYLDALSQQNDLFSDGVDLSRKLLDSHENLSRAIQESKNVAQKLGGATGNIDTILSSIVRKKVDFSDMFADVLPSINDANLLITKIQEDINGLVNNLSGSEFDIPLNFSPNTQDLDQEIGKILNGIDQEKSLRMAALDEYFAKNTKLQTQLSRQFAASISDLDMKVDMDTGNIQTTTGVLKKGMIGYEEAAKQLDDIASKSDLAKHIKERYGELVGLIQLGTKRTEDQNQRLTTLLGPLDLATKMLVEEYEVRQDDLETLKQSVLQEKNRFKALSAYSGQLASAEKMVMKIGSGFDYINSVLPSGVGDFLGLGDASAKLLEGHKKGVQAFAESLGKGATQSEAIASYMGSFGPVLRLALNPLTLIVAGVLLLKELVEGIVEKYKQMQEQMKISLVQARDLLVVQLDILTSQKNQFATMEDIMTAQAAMIGSSGKVFDIMDKGNKELTINLIEIGKAFGYGTEQAVNLHKTFERLGADDTLAQNLQTNLGLMSEMAGLSPQIIAQDLLDSADEVALYFAGYPEQAARAAIEVRRLGFSLKQAGSIAQKMLNLEGFMTDMYELMAMSGQKIDFSGAFEKGLMGDIEGMTREIMEEIGTTADLNKMDYLTRMKIANTLGMSANELSKSVMLHEKMNGLTKEEQTALQGNLDRMGDISNMSQDEIKNRLQQLQSTDRLGVAWDKIKGTLVKALLPLAEAFAEVLDALMPILDLVIMAFKSIVYIIKPLMPIIKLILLPLKAIGMVLESVTSKLDELGGGLGEIGKIAMSIGTIFGTWFIGKKLLGGFGSIKDAMGGILSSIPGVGALFGKAKSDAAQTSAQVVATTQTATDQIAQSAAKSAQTISNAGTQAQTTVAQVGKQAQQIPVGKLTIDSTTAITQAKQNLDSIATKTDEVVAKTSKTSGGFLKNLSKGGFKLVGKASAVTFSLMAADMARGFLSGEKSGEESMDNLKQHGMTMFGGLAISGAGMLSTYLEEGIAETVKKISFKGVEDKLQGPLKNVRKGFEQIGPLAAKSLDPIKSGTKNIFGKVLDSAKSIFPKTTTMATSAFDKIGDKFKGKGILGRIFGTATDVTDQAQEIQSTIQDTSQTVQDTVKKVQKTDIVGETTKKLSETTIKTPKKVEETLPKKLLPEPKPEIVKPEAKKAVPTPKTTKQILPDLSSQEKDVAKKSSSIRQMVTNTFSGLETLLKKVWQGIKTVIVDISRVISQVLKNISAALGETIKNLLKGIADGLNQFKASTIKGAATLVILSGALWITSKALQNFAQVKWEDVAKGMVTIGVLAGIALLLGSASAQMIMGAIAIALLGAALIPAAYALQMFSDVKWESIGKATVALIALGVAGAVFGSFVPLMLLGAIGIAALGASLIPAAFALQMFNDVEWSAIGKGIVALLGFGAVAALFGLLSPLLIAGSLAIGAVSLAVGVFSGALFLLSKALSVVKKPLDGIAESISNVAKSVKELTAVPFQNLFGVAGGLMAIAGSMAALTVVETGSGLLNTFNKMFGNDLVSRLDQIAKRADPIRVVADSIQSLVSGLLELSQILSNLDFSGLDSLEEFKKIGMINPTQHLLPDQKTDEEETQTQSGVNPGPRIEQDNTRTANGLKIRPEIYRQVIPQPPTKESVAQNERIQPHKMAAQRKTETTQQDNYKQESNPFDPTQPNFKTLEMLLRQLLQETQKLAARPVIVNIDKGTLGQINNGLKAFQNNKG